MSSFCEFKIDEMTDLLYNQHNFNPKHNPLPLNGEITFGKGYTYYNTSFSLRVYSSFYNLNGKPTQRGKGRDAIRVCFLYKNHDGEIKPVTKSKIVKRTKNWWANLSKRIHEMEDIFKNMAVCPLCKLPMIVRNSKNGPFYGCLGFPDCKGTMRLKP